MNEKNDNSLKRLKSNSSPQPSTLPTSSTTNTSQWKDLPTLEIILDYLPFDDVKESSLVCKTWYKQTLSHRFKSIETLALPKIKGFKDGSMLLSEDAQADEYIKPIVIHSNLVNKLIINEQLTDSTLTKLLTTFTNLTELQLCFYTFSLTSLSNIISNCPNLERLTFDTVTIANDSKNPSQLKSIQFPNNLSYLSFHESFIDLESGIDENFLISHDKVSTFKWVYSDSQFLKPLIKSYPSLKHLHLNLYSSSFETIPMVFEILKHNPQISQLVYDDEEPEDEIVDLIFHQMTQIEDLTFSAYLSTSNFIIKTKTNHILKYLDLSKYTDKKIKLTKALLPNCPNLETLSIYIGHRRDQVMDLIADNCPKLRDLTLIDSLMDFPYRQSIDSWKDQIVDLDFINRRFRCANILNRLLLKNIMITKQGIKAMQQFSILKEVRFEFQTEDDGKHAVNSFIDSCLDDLPNTTIREDHYNYLLMGSIYLPNNH